ncbi:hypothetical protein [Streptosporangium sp. NPDC002607]
MHRLTFPRRDEPVKASGPLTAALAGAGHVGGETPLPSHRPVRGVQGSAGEAVAGQCGGAVAQLDEFPDAPFELVEGAEGGAVQSLVVDAHLRDARAADVGTDSLNWR